MRFDPVQIVTAGDMSTGTVTSIGVDVNQMYAAAVQAVWSGGGTPAGTFALQVSSDIVQVASGTNPAANVVNWITYTNSQVPAGGADGSFLWNLNPMGYRWIRLQYIRTSGTDSLNAIFTGKD